MQGVYVADPKKQEAKAKALSQTQRARQEVSMLLGEVRRLASQLDYAAGGAPSGIDRALTGCCRWALSELDSAQSCLNSAAGEIRVLESGEWVPEEAVKGGWS